MDTCDYCHDELAPPASPTIDPHTDEVRLACDRCGHIVSLELAAHPRRALLAA